MAVLQVSVNFHYYGTDLRLPHIVGADYVDQPIVPVNILKIRRSSSVPSSDLNAVAHDLLYCLTKGTILFSFFSSVFKTGGIRVRRTAGWGF